MKIKSERSRSIYVNTCMSSPFYLLPPPSFLPPNRPLPLPSPSPSLCLFPSIHHTHTRHCFTPPTLTHIPLAGGYGVVDLCDEHVRKSLGVCALPSLAKQRFIHCQDCEITSTRRRGRQTEEREMGRGKGGEGKEAREGGRERGRDRTRTHAVSSASGTRRRK